jgi:hypothetical protein
LAADALRDLAEPPARPAHQDASCVGACQGQTAGFVQTVRSKIRQHGRVDHSVMAVRFLPPLVLKSSLIKVTSEVAGAAAATPTSFNSGA